MQHCWPVWLHLQLQSTAGLFKGCLIMLCSGSRFSLATISSLTWRETGRREAGKGQLLKSTAFNTTMSAMINKSVTKLLVFQNIQYCSGQWGRDDMRTSPRILIFARKPS